MNLFFALLAFVALGGALVVALSVVAPVGPLARFRADLSPLAPWLAWVVAATCTAGSLYYSEIAHYVPCRFCWYQRIAMYPLAVILGIAAFRRDRGVAIYAIPLAVIGGAISIYHYQLQLFPEQSTICSMDSPCTTREVNEFGFVTIPFMALAGFAAIVALLAAARRTTHAPATADAHDQGHGANDNERSTAAAEPTQEVLRR